MRPRTEIEEEELTGYGSGNYENSELILETLLDIRELLQDINTRDSVKK